MVDLKKYVEEGDSHRARLLGINHLKEFKYCCNNEFWPFFYPLRGKKPSLTKYLQMLANKHKVNFFKEEGDSHYEIYFCVTIDGDSVFANGLFDIDYNKYLDDVENPDNESWIMPE